MSDKEEIQQRKVPDKVVSIEDYRARAVKKSSRGYWDMFHELSPIVESGTNFPDFRQTEEKLREECGVDYWFSIPVEKFPDIMELQTGAMQYLVRVVSSSDDRKEIRYLSHGFHAIAPTGQPNEFYGQTGANLYRFQVGKYALEKLEWDCTWRPVEKYLFSL